MNFRLLRLVAHSDGGGSRGGVIPVLGMVLVRADKSTLFLCSSGIQFLGKPIKPCRKTGYKVCFTREV